MLRNRLSFGKTFVLLLALAAYFHAVPALAASIDFTDTLFSACNNQTSCEKTMGVVKIRIEGWKDAAPQDGVFNPLVDTPAPLFWEATDPHGYHDGFGVRTGELDEIERPEFLVVRFLKADDPGGPGNWHYVKHMISELDLTNLFNENGYLERGAYRITVNGTDGDWVPFLADSSQVLDTTNGVRHLPVPTPPYSEEMADYVLFTAPEPGYVIPEGQNHEYSLAGIDAHAIYTLSASRIGTGSGTVTSDLPGINCGLACTKYYDAGTNVVLTATPGAGSAFSGWAGDCDGSGHVTLNADKSCVATFTAVTYSLSITTAGTGSGTASGAGTYNYGDTATVSASALTGSTFTGWTGPNAAECATGSVAMTANKVCTANFTLNTYTLTLNTTGNGSGTVSGAGTYNYGQTASVSKAANPGSTFTGWTGPDAGECASGSVPMTANKSCTANFALIAYTLTLDTAGSGSGTVSGAGTYNYGQTAIVTQSADPSSIFTGWTGPDAAECAAGSVVMTSNKNCTANFTLNTYTLTITMNGGGSGSVSGAGTYDYGQTATVTQSANPGSTFTGWTGPNAAECAAGSVLMNSDKSCTASFTLNAYTLTITMSGGGSGTVSGAGIYTYGQTATVTQTANSGSSFSGWSGPDGAECGSGSVLMNADKNCTATFDLIHPTGGGSGNGLVYFSNQDSANPSIGILDPVTETIVATIPVSGTPTEIAAHPGGGFVYAMTGTDLSVIDTSSNQLAATLPGVGDFIYQHVVVSPDGNRLYLLYRQQLPSTLILKVFDTTNPVAPVLVTTISNAMFNVCYAALGLAVSPDGSHLYLACRQSASGVPDRFFMVNTATNTPTLTASFPRDAGNYYFVNALAVTPDGSKVYVARTNTSGTSTVEYFDASTGARLGSISLPANATPRAAAFTPDGSKLYVVDQMLGTHVIDPATNTRIKTMSQLNSRGTDIAMLPDGTHAFTANIYQLNDLEVSSDSGYFTISGPVSPWQITAAPAHP